MAPATDLKNTDANSLQSCTSDYDSNYTDGTSESADSTESLQVERHWQRDVARSVSSEQWLHSYGLVKNKLDVGNLLKVIGFRHSDEYDASLRKPVCSRYGDKLFTNYFKCEGRSYTLFCSLDDLKQFERRLTAAVSLYRKRLDWLTTDSRRFFGVIEERGGVAIVLDVTSSNTVQMNPRIKTSEVISDVDFSRYCAALDKVVLEQLKLVSRFNLLRSSEDTVEFSKESVVTSGDSIAEARHWLQQLNESSIPIGPTGTCQTVLRAAGDKTIDAVYLFTDGSCIKGSKDLLKEKLSRCRVPVHVISHGCVDRDSLAFLRSMAEQSRGRFHAYAMVMSSDHYQDTSLLSLPDDLDIIDSSQDKRKRQDERLRKRVYAGMPTGAGMRKDVMRIFDELEDARANLLQIRELIKDYSFAGKPKAADKLLNKTTPLDFYFTKDRKSPRQPISSRSETYMSSKEWLKTYGIRAKKLGFYETLGSVAFPHRDGVVRLQGPPGDLLNQTDAIKCDKLVNARYCDRFAHVRWKDGRVAHVQVTPEVHRNYQRRVNLALDAIQQRIDWLHEGSRELFGAVIEERVYLLVDTSQSMLTHLDFVRDRVYALMQEQLRHKQRFNLVSFNTKAQPWKDRLVEVNERSLESACKWLKSLTCQGSTNTLAALRSALSDPNTEAIYLLTDGRPDQPCESILAQLQLHPPIPVHTISFNCADAEANAFLYRLAKDTGGRFHYYSENGVQLQSPEPWQSEDVRILEDEMKLGKQNLEKIALLRDECAQLAWRSDTDNRNRSKSASPRISCHRAKLSRFNTDPRRSLDNGGAPGGGIVCNSERPSSAASAPAPPIISRSSHDNESYAEFSPLSSRSLKSRSEFFQLKDRTPKTCVAAQTRTSLLRSLTCKRENYTNEWMLPESQKLFDRQWQRQKQSIIDTCTRELVDKPKMNTRRKLSGRTCDDQLSSAEYLSRHGLVARKLTLVDALAPTFIPHKRKYVAVLKKHVASKVFDDLLPIAHESGDKSIVNLVNPQATNLDTYCSKVKQAIEGYKTYESKKPISYMINKDSLLDSLERCDWPLPKVDVVRLEDEINNGINYIKQAKRSAVGKKKRKSLKTRPHKIRHLRSTSSGLVRGQRVIGRNSLDGFYYNGCILRAKDSRHALVAFKDIGVQTVANRFLLPCGGAISRPPLNKGDYVLAKVINQDTGLECFVPGMISIASAGNDSKFHAVDIYTNQQACFLRSYLTKIGQLHYTFMIRYIQSLNEQSKTRSDDKSEDEDEDNNNDYEDEEDAFVQTPEQIERESEDSERGRLEKWKNELLKQKHQQKKAQKNLRHQAKKLSEIQKDLLGKQSKMNGDQEQLLQLIIRDMKDKNENRDGYKLGEEKYGLSGEVLQIGDEVLYRSKEDGWFYRGTIRQTIDNGEAAGGGAEFLVEDGRGDLCTTSRRDLIADCDDVDVRVQPRDAVVALHPEYKHSYAPGVVLSVSDELTVEVRLYDGAETRLSRDEIYVINGSNFDEIVLAIEKAEKSWVGQAVVARRDNTGDFHLGEVIEQVNNGREYSIRWADDTVCRQRSTFIFGANSRPRDGPASGGAAASPPQGYVLAVEDERDLRYLPGVMAADGSVRFCNDVTKKNLDPNQCFPLSKDYYENIVNFYDLRRYGE